MTLEMMHGIDQSSNMGGEARQHEEEKEPNPFRKLSNEDLERAFRRASVELQDLTNALSALQQLRTALLHDKINMGEVIRERSIDMSDFLYALHHPARVNPDLFGTDADDNGESLDEHIDVSGVAKGLEVSDVHLSLEALAHVER